MLLSLLNSSAVMPPKNCSASLFKRKTSSSSVSSAIVTENLKLNVVDEGEEEEELDHTNLTNRG